MAQGTPERERSYTTDNNTRATIPGKVQVHWGRWARAFPRPMLFLGGVLVLSFLLFGLTRQYIVLVCGFVALSGLWKNIALHVREHFRFGCANPAIVLSVSPPRLAVYTDLATSPRTTYRVIKVIAPPLHLFAGGTPAVGAKTVTVSLYERGNEVEQTGHWSNFKPVPVALVVADKAQVDKAQQRIPQEWWDFLDIGVHALPIQVEPGCLYPFSPTKAYDKN